MNRLCFSPSSAPLLLAVWLLLTFSDRAPCASPKIGWAGSDIQEINAANASWYYHWWHVKPGGDANANADWVPLIKFYSTPQNLQNKLDLIKSYTDVDTVLVLNEPERASQSDVTVSEAIGFWPQVQQELPNHKLVSPGVSDDPAGRAWLEDFMGQVDARNSNGNPNDDLRVDAVAFHWYGASTPNNPVGAANNFLSRVDAYHNQYGLPVWITEFAIHDWGGNYTDAQVLEANAIFLDTIIPALESRSYVERYSFYQHFSDADLFTQSPLTPTVVGDAFVGSLYAGEEYDLAGESRGTDVFYLRGGSITNSGAAIPSAMRAIDVIEGVSAIRGGADWRVTGDASVTVRSAATLRKLDGSTVVFQDSDTVNNGALEIVEGRLSVVDGQLSGAGVYRVGENATLQLSAAGGRAFYPLVGAELAVEGVVEGPIIASNGAKITVLNSAASFASDLIANGATISVGGSGFNEQASSPAIVAANLALNFDVALDAPGDSVWQDASPTGAATQFAAGASPTTVSDPALPGLSAAYDIANTGLASGLNGHFETQSPQLSRRDATFEIVFEVSDTNAGSQQVLLDLGATRGVSFTLDGDVLNFSVDGDGAASTLSQSLSQGWRHVVGVIDLTGTDDNLANDSISLYVDNALVGTLNNLLIDDWAGGNPTGIGGGAAGVTAAGAPIDFHGRIASARYYSGAAFSPAEVQQNYESLTRQAEGSPTTMNIEGDLTLHSGSAIELDISDNGAADKIALVGTLALTGGVLDVSYLGSEGLQSGDQFDLFDFGSATGAFSELVLPALAPGLMWNAERLLVSGELAVVIQGDYNGDGAIDAADYTTWRDSLGESVTPFTGADGSGDGSIALDDYLIWRTRFTAPLETASVPEPSCMLLLAFLIADAGPRPTIENRSVTDR